MPKSLYMNYIWHYLQYLDSSDRVGFKLFPLKIKHAKRPGPTPAVVITAFTKLATDTAGNRAACFATDAGATATDGHMKPVTASGGVE